MANILGFNGNCTLPTGHNATLKTWSATVSRTVHDVTALSNTGMVRELGIQDIQGSAGGIMKDGSDTPGFFSGAQASGASAAQIVLTAATGNTITFNCVIDTITASVDVTGDAPVTFNFQMSDGNGADIAWS
tara:strand:- start:487 stop:882 length:396 start_codon:yes stop_codon:yes gene_type:complete